MKTKLHFARFEFKYILPRSLRDQVESETRFFLEFDPFVAERRHHRYFVRSLYFDDPAFTSFHDKLDGLHTRSKFRVRTYADNPEEQAPVFLEIKGRHNNLVLKHRVQLDTRERPLNEVGNSLERRILSSAPDTPVREPFEYELFRKRIMPVALIDYWRRPYLSKYDPEFRLTFDEELSATKCQTLFPGYQATRKALLQGYTVLEVKFRYHIPSWFHRIILSYQLQRISISKICVGIETLGLAHADA